jgi:protein phosphatase 1 regulatory subunit 11
MPPSQQTQPESGSRTITQTATPVRDADQNANNGESSAPTGVLKLRGGPSRRQRVVWSEGTVDNEGMGKKKSKSTCCPYHVRVCILADNVVCCIYHKPKAYDESSDESESDCDHDHHPKPATKSRRKEEGGGDAVAESSESEGGGGDGKAKYVA